MSIRRISGLEVLIWIILVIIVLLALSPYVIGYKAKSDYAYLINQISKNFQVDLQVSTYNQGFFSSQATLGLTLPNSSETIYLNEEIVHGPIYLGLLNQNKSPLIAAVINGKLDMGASHLPEFNKILSGTNPLLYQHLINFSGDVDSQLYVPAIMTVIQDEEESVHLESSGAIYTQFLSSASGNVKGEMSIPLIKIHKTNFNMNLEESVVSFSGKKGNNKLMIGDTVISVGSLNIDSAEEQFAVKKLIVHSVTSENSELINAGTRVTAREILASNQKFGPIVLNFGLNGFNANSIHEIQKINKALDNQLKQGLSEEEVDAIMQAKLMAVIPDLIKQAEVNINPLSINSELGRLEADMEFKMLGIDAKASTDPLMLLSAIDFQLNMSIDEPLMRKVIFWNLDHSTEIKPSLINAKVKSENSYELMSRKVDDNLQAMMEVNWLVKDEGVYLSKISMQQGELLINGVSADALQQIMSSVTNDAEVAIP